MKYACNYCAQVTFSNETMYQKHLKRCAIKQELGLMKTKIQIKAKKRAPTGKYEEINDEDFDFDDTAEVIVKEEVMEEDFDSTFEEEIDPLMFLQSEVLQEV